MTLKRTKRLVTSKKMTILFVSLFCLSFWRREGLGRQEDKIRQPYLEVSRMREMQSSLIRARPNYCNKNEAFSFDLIAKRNSF